MRTLRVPVFNGPGGPKKGDTSMANFMNLTPHAINFVSQDGDILKTVEPSGSVARVSVKTETIGEADGIPVTSSVYGEIKNLPEPEEGTIYIVSSLVAGRTKRKDVFIPNEPVRDEKGRIIGCRSLGRV